MSKDTTVTLRSLIYTLNPTSPPTATLSVLDQLLLPHETTYIPIHNVHDAWSVIRSMQIRGAPLIAIVAVLGLAVDLTSNEDTVKQLDGLSSVEDIKAVINEKMEYLKTSRPTAVNLFNAMEELTGILDDASLTTREALLEKLTAHASYMLDRDVSDNKSIGSHGADDILSGRDEKVNVVTICNTGSLATAGWGTALGVARELCARDKLEGIACLETRP
eukprot:scaffold324_cov57-Cyclotella_meneghiniana.AAC.7